MDMQKAVRFAQFGQTDIREIYGVDRISGIDIVHYFIGHEIGDVPLGLFGTSSDMWGENYVIQTLQFGLEFPITCRFFWINVNGGTAQLPVFQRFRQGFDVYHKTSEKVDQ